ncbi:hypothetical protein AAEX28_12440 [Lentisphaerota bacterium WC36G]|nr:hypothetical protein LJT99_15265 [Lentisphaerae bacterium WC36]
MSKDEIIYDFDAENRSLKKKIKELNTNIILFKIKINQLESQLEPSRVKLRKSQLLCDYSIIIVFILIAIICIFFGR